MDELLKALRRQFEFMVDDEDNGVDSFYENDEPGDHFFGFVMEDGSEYTLTAEEAK